MSKKRILIILGLLIVIVIIGIVVWQQQVRAQLKTVENTAYGLKFSYPKDWQLEQNSKAENMLEYRFVSPSYSEQSVGHRLVVNIFKASLANPSAPAPEDCPKDRAAGTMSINGKTYNRCDLGSGVHVYTVAFSVSTKSSQLNFDFTYNSGGGKEENITDIENIIKSFKF